MCCRENRSLFYGRSESRTRSRMEKSLADSSPTLIYLDTNVYSRPFDDQTRTDIQEETTAFLEIIAEVESGKLALLSSDILDFEVHNIVSEGKRVKIKETILSFAISREFNNEVQPRKRW